jgi:hypothetical protein
MSRVEHVAATERKRRAIQPLSAWLQFLPLAFRIVALAYATPPFAETRCAGDKGPRKPRLTV